MDKYRFLEHTADAQFIAYGKSLSDAFENVGLATFEVMLDTDKINPVDKQKIKIEADDIEELVYKWLSEIIFIFSAEKMVFSRFNVEIKEKEGLYTLNSEVFGEKIDMEKHKIHTEVKAPTYHNLSVSINDVVEIKVLLDT